jgi:cadmium resistance protein CadD (predicted permease)
MSEKKRKTFYWLFKALSVLIACALPVWAIMERFPVWKTMYGKTHSIGVGGILVIIVLAIIFRTTVFNFIRDKLKITHAPPLAVWLILIAIAYVLVFIGQFLQDVVIVLWMGLIGCSAGTVLTFIAEHKFDDKKEEEHGQS